MELGETDLSSLLQRERKDGTGFAAAMAAKKPQQSTTVPVIDLNLLRWVWQGMLQAVAPIHAQRIVHGDLKPANFVLVRGKVKLIDFGIADAIVGDTTNIHRESQVGTINYMAPEAFNEDAKVGTAYDIWSLGCILYEMVFGRKPFAHIRGNLIAKIRAIADPSCAISFKELDAAIAAAPDTTQCQADLLHVLQSCLQRNPKARPTIQVGGSGDTLLTHPFLLPGTSRSKAAAAAQRSSCTRGGDERAVHVSKHQLRALLSQFTSGTHRLSSSRLAPAVDAVFEALLQSDTVDAAAPATAPAAAAAGDVGSSERQLDLTPFLRAIRHAASHADGAASRHGARTPSSSSSSSASSARRRNPKRRQPPVLAGAGRDDEQPHGAQPRAATRTSRRRRSNDSGSAAGAGKGTGSKASARARSAGGSGGGGGGGGGGVPSAQHLLEARARLQPAAKRRRSSASRRGKAGPSSKSSSSASSAGRNRMTQALRERLALIRQATAPREDSAASSDSESDEDIYE